MKRIRIFSIISIVCLALAGCGGSSGSSLVFELRIENISPEPTTFTTASGQPLAVVFSAGAGAVHLFPAPIYSLGEPARDNGLEGLAEEGNAQDLAQSLQEVEGVTLALLAALPVEEGATGGVLAPGQSYRVLFNVESELSFLSLALGFLQSNDVFVATPPEGVPLFDAEGNPRTADITAAFSYYDAGTEVNQAPGDGPDQPPRQMEENQGTAENGIVRLVDDGFSYPAVGDVLRISIAPLAEID